MASKPFVKWAGGKIRLLDQLHKRLPPDLQDNGITNYIEPFVGSGSFFFSIADQYKIDEYIINDKNEILMVTYRVIKENPEALIQKLAEFEDIYMALNEKERVQTYYEKRKRFNYIISRGVNNKNLIEASSLFIFLNKTCYNGIFRLNANGEFNVPMGYYPRPNICNKERIINASNILQSVKIRSKDFRKFFSSLKQLGPQSFMYVDPPYAIKNGNNGFLGYNDKIFSWEDQKILAEFLDKFRLNGVNIMMSNARHHDISKLYQNFFQSVIKRKTVIGGIPSSRRTIREVIITSYPVVKNSDSSGTQRRS